MSKMREQKLKQKVRNSGIEEENVTDNMCWWIPSKSLDGENRYQETITVLKLYETEGAVSCI